MKKDVSNVIPESLYKLITIYRNKIKDKKQKYLFVSDISSAYQVQTFANKFNKGLESFNIKNLDGSRCWYRAYDYRHIMEDNMRK